MQNHSLSKAASRETGAPFGTMLPAATSTLPDPQVDRPTWWLWSLAVREDGRRVADAPLVSRETAAAAAARRDVSVVLGHAGPAAAVWREGRAVGAADVPEISTARRPRALDEPGWAAVVAAFVEAAGLCREAGCHDVLVDAADDGLLATTMSPLGNPSADRVARRAPLERVVAGVASTGLKVGVVLTVEELTPHGLTAADGIDVARAVVAQGASFLVVRAGSARFADLWTRERRMGTDEPWLASALWLPGRVEVPVWAAGPVGDLDRAHGIAAEAGLAGIVMWTPRGHS